MSRVRKASLMKRFGELWIINCRLLNKFYAFENEEFFLKSLVRSTDDMIRRKICYLWSQKKIYVTYFIWVQNELSWNVGGNNVIIFVPGTSLDPEGKIIFSSYMYIIYIYEIPRAFYYLIFGLRLLYLLYCSISFVFLEKTKS